MAKGMDRGGRQDKKKKKLKKPAAGTAPPADLNFKHHSVVQEPPRNPE